MSSFSFCATSIPRTVWLLATSIAMLLMMGDAWIGAASGQGRVSIRAQVDRDEVYVGESIRFQIHVENAQGASNPSLDGIEEDFDIAFLGEHPMQQSSTSFVNGRMMSRTLYRNTLEYTLTAKKIGEFEIPVLKLEFQGEVYETSPISVKVIEPEAQDIVLVEVRSSAPYVYPTQWFDVSLVILVKTVPGLSRDPVRMLARNPPEISLPWIQIPDGLESQDSSEWLQQYISDSGTGFSINGISTAGAFLFDSPRLALFQLYDGQETRADSSGEEVTYDRYLISRRMKAIRPGKYSFGPVMVKGTFPVRYEGEQLIGKRVAAVGQPLEVMAKEVPADRPDTFIGGIGAYRVDASASPVRGQVGDPITLTLTVVSPDGDLDLISAPKLNRVQEIVDGFELLDPEPIGISDNGAKRYRYAMRPKSINATIPALHFHVFDPVTETFQEIRTEPIGLEISEAEVVDLPNESPGNGKGDLHGGGIQSDLTQSEALGGLQFLSGERGATGRAFWTIRTALLFVAGAWGVALLLLGGLFVRSKWLERVGGNRRTDWRAHLLQVIAAAQEQLALSDERAAFQSLRRSLGQIVLNDPSGQMHELVTGELMIAATERGYSVSTLGQLKELLGELDAKLYSRQYLASDSDLLHRFEQVFGLLEREASSCRPSIPSSVNASSLNTSTVRGASGRLFAKCVIWLVVSPAVLNSLAIATTELPAELPTELSAELPRVDTVDRLREDSSAAEARAIAAQIEAQVHDLVHRPRMIFELGNAWSLAGDHAKALYCFEMASRHWPSNSAVRHNLQLAKLGLNEHRGDVKTDSNGIDSWLVRSMRWGPSYWLQLAIGAIAGAASAAGLVVASLARNAPGLKTGGRWVSGIGAGIALMLVPLIGMNSPELYYDRMGIVSQEAIGREGMSQSSEQAYPEAIAAGEEIRVLQRTPNWTLVRHSRFGDAWIETSKLVYRFR